MNRQESSTPSQSGLIFRRSLKNFLVPSDPSCRGLPKKKVLTILYSATRHQNLHGPLQVRLLSEASLQLKATGPLIMLVEYPRRQQASSFAPFHHHYQGLSSPPTTACLPPLTSPGSDYDYDLSTHLAYDNISSAESYNTYSLASPDYYMPAQPSYNPPIRVHQSTSSPGVQPVFQPSQVDSGRHSSGSWSGFDNNNNNNFALLTPQSVQQHVAQQHIYGLQAQPSHQRHSSSSSIGSVGPASPYTPTAVFPQILDTDLIGFPSPSFDTFDHHQSAATTFPKALPIAPQRTFTESFIPHNYQDYYGHTEDAQNHLTSMRQVVMARHGSEGGEASPAARNAYSNMPKLDRTMSDVYQDELYNPNITPTTQSQQARPPTSQSSLLSPHRDHLSQRLQAANNARSESPTTRQRSPFRPDSEYAADIYPKPSTTPRRVLNSSTRLSGAQLSAPENDNFAAQQTVDDTRTISPKEVSLDYVETAEDSRTPLFPQETSTTPVMNHFTVPKPLATQESTQSDAAETGTQQSFHSMATTRRQSSSNYSSGSGLGQTRSKVSISSPTSTQIPQQYPFISQSRRQNSSMQSSSGRSPEFHATLTSMESTKSDCGFKSSQEQNEGPTEIQRPARTTADSGTYTCTYHGCTQRFETPAKLQKHKREGHRIPTPQTGSHGSDSPTGSGSSAAALLAARNSQAGPHKCERINPTTGKPCNSVFSRPYDLTRHEDTIHNSRKQKVRCHLCTEEKTFSRNDALTRHMRVVHPEVDFPGKTKRKGGS